MVFHTSTSSDLCSFLGECVLKPKWNALYFSSDHDLYLLLIITTLLFEWCVIQQCVNSAISFGEGSQWVYWHSLVVVWHTNNAASFDLITLFSFFVSMVLAQWHHLALHSHYPSCSSFPQTQILYQCLPHLPSPHPPCTVHHPVFSRDRQVESFSWCFGSPHYL